MLDHQHINHYPQGTKLIFFLTKKYFDINNERPFLLIPLLIKMTRKDYQLDYKQIPSKIKNKNLVIRRRQQISEAVIKLFSRKGYHKTTLRDISKESGITLGNLYDYISTKEDTLYFIRERANQAVIEAVSKGEGKKLDPIEKLRMLIVCELEAMNRYQETVMS